jgi:hypothetical protein
LIYCATELRNREQSLPPTVRLGLPTELRRSLACTNIAENLKRALCAKSAEREAPADSLDGAALDHPTAPDPNNPGQTIKPFNTPNAYLIGRGSVQLQHDFQRRIL